MLQSVLDISQFPETVADIAELRETFWVNPNTKPADEGIKHSGLTLEDALDAELRLKRFAPLLAAAFPELAPHGIIESQIASIPKMKAELENTMGKSGKIPGQLWLKLDSHLPVSGSIKARGGIYEVLAHAEKLALEAGLLKLSDDYSILLSQSFVEFFSKHKIAVGSTGNLGLSIGIMSARLGFHVTVHMSADARQWKKDMLRERGALVVEHAEDYGFAVEKGREAAESDPSCFFIDDENSKTLFLGYSVAGLRMKQQLSERGVVVDEHHPLFVYLPCGVGGGPGGVSFGLKLVFGDNVHCFFAEPTNSPCMTLGLATGLHDQISVQELGISNKTVADGLAVGRASGFVGRAMEQLIDGSYTLSDKRMFQMLAQLNNSEGISLEPSALAGMYGPVILPQSNDYRKFHPSVSENMENATHLVWATGGSMVPPEIMANYLAQGQKDLADLNI